MAKPITAYVKLQCNAGAATPAPKPNVVFILADDSGLGEFGCYGGTAIATPNIDRIAREGMRFTRAYSGSAVCAPTRGVLMTGQHTGHTRIRGNHGQTGLARVPLKASDVTVAEVMKSAGYATAIAGKWGLGEPGTEGIPNRQGFDRWFGYLNNDLAEFYYPEKIWRNEEEITLPGNIGGRRGQYSNDLMTEEARRTHSPSTAASSPSRRPTEPAGKIRCESRGPRSPRW